MRGPLVAIEDRIKVRAARSVDPRRDEDFHWTMAISDGSGFAVVAAWMTGGDYARIESDPDEWAAAWMVRRVRSLPRDGRRLRTLELHSPLQMRP